MNRTLRVMVMMNFLVASVMAAWAFLLPAAILIRDLRDPGLWDGTIPRSAFRRHAALAPRYAAWARERVGSGRAARLRTSEVAATEWPMFGSVFFLWATEALQDAWQADPALASVEPRRAAAGAVEAAADLVADPNHAAWVKTHWGSDYLERENLFYRMLLIGGLTSYQKLTGNARYQALLGRQVETLTAEIDASPHGLLDDYPGECYPIDVLPAIAAIRRADTVLGTDHRAFAARALRAFEGDALDPQTGLPSYEVSSQSGRGIGPARGIGAAYMLIWAPSLWPETARRWWTAFEEHFWQRGPLLEGLREYPRGHDVGDWSMDVDAGPVMFGYGFAASAFGIGAARANGRLDMAYALAAEALAVSWPLPDGTLLIPRLLSNVADSPYLGESALLFCLSRSPIPGSKPTTAGGRVTPLVGLMVAFYIGTGLLVIASALRALRRWRRGGARWVVPLLRVQFGLWAILTIAGLAALLMGQSVPGLLLLLSAQLFPRLARVGDESAPIAADSSPPPRV